MIAAHGKQQRHQLSMDMKHNKLGTSDFILQKATYRHFIMSELGDVEVNLGDYFIVFFC